jgi:DNA-binding transcriptional regulator YhcF (GntR family)
MKDILQIEPDSQVPKYKQIVKAINLAVGDGKLKIGDHLPSINAFCKEFSISRETVITAYKELCSIGLVSSSQRKGYYISASKSKLKHKVFLFLDEFNSFKEVLYNGLTEGFLGKGNIEVYFHHFNFKIFETIINENIGKFTSYVIMPIPHRDTQKLFKSIPEGKLFILDVGLEPFGKIYPSVCQNFEKDILSALNSASDLLVKYNKQVLVYPEVIQKQEATIKGFLSFCKERNIQNEVIENAVERTLTKGEAYIVIQDSDLVHLIHHAKAAALELGKDIGIISYNETPLKSVVATGVTVLTTDFKGMGTKMAEMILSGKKDHVENLSYMIRRGSL